MKDKRGSSNSALCLQCWHPSVVRCASLALIGNTCDLILCVCGGIDSPMTRNEGKNTTSIVGILQVKRSGPTSIFDRCVLIAVEERLRSNGECQL